MSKPLELQKLNFDFTVCKINSMVGVDFTRDFVFLSKTDGEISLVCPSDCVPTDAVAAEPGWKALRISGVLDFGMIGVISKISSLLAESGICIFVISTYNTDYILFKSACFDVGIRTLTDNGYIIK